MHNRIIDQTFTQDGATEPVTRTEAKVQCIVDHTNDDAYIDDLITRCRKEIETICGISIVETEVVLIVDWHTSRKLPYGPVQSVDLVEFQVNEFEDFETVDTDDYKETGGLLASRKCGRHRITYTTGFETVPEDLKKTVLQLIAFRYTNRGDHEAEMSEDLKQQILSYKDYSWA